jgi:hypothetical protein
MGRDLVKTQTVPEHTADFLYRSLAFVITSQATGYERPLRFTQSLSRVPLEMLADENFMTTAARSNGLGFGEDRYSEIYHFMREQGGIDHALENARADPIGFREKITKVRHIQLKSASFILFAWGIDASYLILDVHHARQLAGLGLDVDDKHYDRTRVRSDGRKINESFGKMKYLAIEREAIDFLKMFPALQDAQGGLDCRLTSAIIWGAGAIGSRGHNPYQGQLFGTHIPSAMQETPFTPPHEQVKTMEEALALFIRATPKKETAQYPIWS